MSHDLEVLTNKRRGFATATVLLILILTVADMIFDRIEGVGWSHIAVEILVAFGCVSVLLSLWWHTLTALSEDRSELKRQLVETRADLREWKARTQELLEGLGKAIHDQFKNWGLTPAEQEVALLLLKGLSVKEIAVIRETKEKTVRHQAAAVYRKAEVEGRNELSAFFLEDLFLPITPDTPL
jgi:DNA-binding CsgD family transcriptional regulator